MVVPGFFAIEVYSTKGAGPHSIVKSISLTLLAVCMFSHDMIDQSFTCHEHLWTLVTLDTMILMLGFNVVDQFILGVHYITALVAFKSWKPLHGGLLLLGGHHLGARRLWRRYCHEGGHTLGYRRRHLGGRKHGGQRLRATGWGATNCVATVWGAAGATNWGATGWGATNWGAATETWGAVEGGADT